MELSNEIIRKFDPCYDPASVGIPDGEVLNVKEWIAKYRNIVESEADIVWLLTRNDFMSDKDLRLFAVWCAREAMKFIENPNPRSIAACDVSERFANGNATEEELDAAMSAAMSVARSAARSAAWSVARSAAAAATSAARSAAMSAAMSAARSAAWSAARSAAAAATSAYDSADSAESAAARLLAARSAQVDKLLTYFE